MNRITNILGSMAIVLVLLAPSHAADFMSVSQAAKKSASGEILLVDIRRPSEWRETGSPKTGVQISMHNAGFLEKLAKQTNGDKSAPVALICKHGNRSTWLAAELEKQGYTNVINVQEGMLGSAKGPGWVKTGLPVK